MCIRCGRQPAPEAGDYCPSCGVASRLEVAQGLRELEAYLGSSSADGTSLDERERPLRQ